MSKTAIVVGSTGLVGRHLVEQLLSDDRYAKIICPGRRKLPMSHPQLEVPIVDFDRLGDFASAFRGDDLFICLGTTRASAGSAEAFRKVDLDYVVKSATLGREQGCDHCLLVSSVGADAGSNLLYPKTKGEAENAVKALNFECTSIFRPSALLGKREESRIMESIFSNALRGVDLLVGKLLGGYRPIQAATVAAGMIKVAKLLQSGTHVYASDEIIELVEG